MHQTTFMVIICTDVGDRQIIALCQFLSTLFDRQKVEIRSDGDPEPARYVLRVPAAEPDVREKWPRMKTHLRSKGLLKNVVVTLQGSTGSARVQLWPSVGE